MITCLRFLCGFLASVFVLQFSCPAADSTPPVFRSLTLSPDLVDTSSTQAPITVTASLGGNLSDLAMASVEFRSPSQQQSVRVYFTESNQISAGDEEGTYENKMWLPQGSEPGEWVIDVAQIVSRSGGSQWLNLSDCLRLGLFARFMVLSTGEATPPPRVTDFNLAPATVDTSETNQVITVITRLVSDGAGGMWLDPASFYQVRVSAAFVSPSRQQSVYLYSYAYFDEASGDVQECVLTNTMVIPRHSESGVWMLDSLQAADAMGNTRNLSLANCLSLGFDTQFTVNGAADVTPPQLVSFEVSPARVDISETNQTLSVQVRVTDDLTGLADPTPELASRAGVSAVFISPSKLQTVNFYFRPSMRASGDERDGVYTNTLVLPRYSEPGRWLISGVFMADTLGNRRSMDLADLTRANLAVPLEVEGRGDATPPRLLSLSLAPANLDVSSASQVLLVTARIQDELAGFANPVPGLSGRASAAAVFRSPSATQQMVVSFSPQARVSGDPQDGVYTGGGIVPRLSEPGLWTLSNFELTDVLGNRLSLDLSDCLRLGFPTQFMVEQRPTLKLAASGDALMVSWPVSPPGFVLESTEFPAVSGSWTPVPHTPVVFGQENVSILPRSTAVRFYRLRK